MTRGEALVKLAESIQAVAQAIQAFADSEPPPEAKSTPFLGLTEVVRRVGVSRQTLINEIRDGRLKAIRTRYEFRVAERDLAAYLEARAVTVSRPSRRASRNP